VDTISFQSQGTRCEAWHLSAETDALTSAAGRPCVVMGHGFGATRDAGLLPFAESFAAAGNDVVVFDYRGFGTSEGAPRQDVNHRRHREDYHAAVAAARALPGVDPDRIAAARRFFNGNVRAYNTRVATFPSNLIASAFKFHRRDFFELTDPASRVAPAVDL